MKRQETLDIENKLNEYLVKAVVSAEMTAYTEDGEPYKTYCWCCALWRGIAVGGIVVIVTGKQIGRAHV